MQKLATLMAVSPSKVATALRKIDKLETAYGHAYVYLYFHVARSTSAKTRLQRGKTRMDNELRGLRELIEDEAGTQIAP